MRREICVDGIPGETRVALLEDGLLTEILIERAGSPGVAGNICILFTANDAYMRDFGLVVPSDCIASNTVEENEHALEQMRRVLKADTTATTELDLDALKRAV